MGVHDGHRARKKQQFLSRGLDGFADHEVLELLLYYAIPRRDTNETAHLLLKKFGSLQGVFSASREELQKVEGVGENAAALLTLLPAVERRLRAQSVPEKILNSTEKTGAYFAQLLYGEKREMFYVVNIDGKGRVLGVKCLSEGTVNMAPITVRQVAENALNSGAAAVFLCHNHPSGVALPSAADHAVTKQIQEVLEPMGIELRDHIIVADGDYVSMAQSGMLL